MGVTGPKMQRMPPINHLLYGRMQAFRMHLLALPWKKFLSEPAGYFLLAPHYDMLHSEQMIVWKCVYDERTLLRPAQCVQKGAESLLRAAQGIHSNAEELLRSVE